MIYSYSRFSQTLNKTFSFPSYFTQNWYIDPSTLWKFLKFQLFSFLSVSSTKQRWLDWNSFPCNFWKLTYGVSRLMNYQCHTTTTRIIFTNFLWEQKLRTFRIDLQIPIHYIEGYLVILCHYSIPHKKKLASFKSKVQEWHRF